MSIRDAIGSFAAVGFVVDVTLNSMEVMMLIADVLFVPFSIFWGTVAPNTDMIDQEAVTWLLLVLAVFYIAHQVTERWRKRRDDIIENAQ